MRKTANRTDPGIRQGKTQATLDTLIPMENLEELALEQVATGKISDMLPAMARQATEGQAREQHAAEGQAKASRVEQKKVEQRKDDALAALRTETALSRFPMHCLTKGDNVQIELKNQASAVLWKLSHNADYGQPSALAYKVDTLFINRRIEEGGRPVPKVIRLGSLREVAEEVGLGTNTNAVKQALLQNATASITAKLNYRTQEQGEQWLEAVFNRYSVVFTGEKLPQGGTADAVYLVLNDIYQQILNTAVFRPLDYEYMKSLPPIAQRFYEIVSYQIFAAVHHGNPRAKLLYSEYCLLSTAKRYFDFEHVKKQMYKVHRPHIQSGYLAKVSYEAIVNEAGETDWWMYYTPGRSAGREYQSFTGTKRGARGKKATSANAEPDALSLPFPTIEETESRASATEDDRAGESPMKRTLGEASTAAPDGDPALADLVARLVAADLNRADAERFARERPAVCHKQLEYLPHVRDFKTSRGAYLRRAIEGDYGPPAAYDKARQQQEQAEAAKRQQARELFEANDRKARQSHEERHYRDYLQYLQERVGELEKAQPEAFIAFKEGEVAQRAALTEGPFANRPLNKKALEVFDREKTRLERCRDYCREHGIPVLTFWEWDETANLEAYRP